MRVILPGVNGVSLGSLDFDGGSQSPDPNARTTSENVIAYSLRTKGVSLVVLRISAAIALSKRQGSPRCGWAATEFVPGLGLSS
jgi:hypothetical protein